MIRKNCTTGSPFHFYSDDRKIPPKTKTSPTGKEAITKMVAGPIAHA